MIVSEVLFEKLEDRIDPEYYSPSYLRIIKRLSKLGGIPLNKIAKISTKRINPNKTPNSTFNYIEIDNIEQETCLISPKKIKGSEAPSRARKLVKKNQIILSLVRPSRRILSIIPSELDGAVCSTGFAVIEPIEVDPYFLLGYLKSDDAVNQMNRFTTASMYPTISEKDVGKILVKLPNKKTQQKISKKIEESISKLNEGKKIFQQTIEKIAKE